MENLKKNQSITNYGKFERKGSSFMFELVYLNGAIRHGYTKPAGQAEPFVSDKFTLLKNAIIRIWQKCNYRAKLQYMTIYRCKSNDNKDNIELFTLYPNEYKLSAHLKSQRREDLEDLILFLKSLYNDFDVYSIKDINNAIELGISPNYNKPEKIIDKRSFDEIYQSSKNKVFKNWKEFDKYIDGLPANLSQQQKNAIISVILENKTNSHLHFK